MTQPQVPQHGAADAPASAPLTAPGEAQQAQAAPRPRVVKARAQGYAAAFGDASGAAFVYRDLASI